PPAEIALSNPLSEEQSAMRTTLLGSLLDVARHNLDRDTNSVALFESGRIYGPSVGAPSGGPLAGSFAGEQPAPFTERHRLGCLAIGSIVPKTWRGEGEVVDFFAMKGALEGLAGQLGVTLGFEKSSKPFLHPGRAAQVLVGATDAGWIGEMHPLVCRGWDLDAAVGFEVELAVLVAAATAGEERFEDVTSYPAVYRDLAVEVEQTTSAADVQSEIRSAAGEFLVSAQIFDLYEGDQVGRGRKSLAFRLTFKAADRTLTDDDVGRSMTTIENRLKMFGGSIRE
ncbi:MAG TPA: hypothetical protein VJ257_00490, partial [Solirubrobacterales bacterium]|nr:hypothetical protein [Solirubrobacterales bacterium]